MNPRLRFRMLPVIALAPLALAGGARAADCALNDNPACGSAIHLGNLAGDAGSPVIQRAGTGEAFFKVYVQESSSTQRALNARVVLQMPTGTDYDLIVRCASCTGPAVQASKQGPGGTEIVNVTRADTFTDNSFWLLIEVRYRSGTGCGQWQLNISGNTAAAQGAMSCG